MSTGTSGTSRSPSTSPYATSGCRFAPGDCCGFCSPSRTATRVNAAEIAREIAEARDDGAPAIKEGREAIETAIKELVFYGYLRRRREQNGLGQWITYSLGLNPKVDEAQSKAMLDTLGDSLAERIGPGWEPPHERPCPPSAIRSHPRFGQDDFGGDEQAAIIRAWRNRRHTNPGEFICHRHRDRERPWLYLQQRGGLLVAAHWPGTALDGSHEISHGVSDEHQRQVEYVQRAGEAAGLEVRTEVRLSTKVIPDAVIYGPHQIGVEVQRSQLTAAAAKTRTTKARRAGVESLWFSDKSSKPPSWFWKVSSVAMMDFKWDTLPRSRSVTVTSGVRVIVPKRCQDMRNGQCPQRRYGCNQWHPDHEHRYETLVDEVAELTPNGLLVPMVFRNFDGREFVLLVSPDDRALYEAMVGRAADVPLRQQKQSRVQPPDRIACAADAGPLVTTAGRGSVRKPITSVEQPATVDVAVWACDTCGDLRRGDARPEWAGDLTGFLHGGGCGGHFYPMR